MRVTLATYGGWAAGLRLGRPPPAVDTSALSEDDAQELTRLVTAAREGPPATERYGMSADEMSYDITVEDEDSRLVLQQSDTTMTQEFAALLRWLHEHMPYKSL